MSRLYLSERGRMLMADNEEITRWRWAGKRFRLPRAAADASADLWLCLQVCDGNRLPLDVQLNGTPLARVAPESHPHGNYWWARVPVPHRRLKAGINDIQLRCDAQAMNAWMLGMEHGHTTPNSAVSTDRGRIWRNHDMGIRNVMRGEYLVRLRSHARSLKDPTPPTITYEDPGHARVRESSDLVPARIRKMRDPWKQILALRTWVATRWSHRPFGPCYTPWDPWSILDWAGSNRGHGQRGTIVMCVHFGALFAALAAALGHRARCIVATEDPNTPSGHFMAEVWDPKRETWVLHDPNYDLHYEDAAPLSAIELACRSHDGLSFDPLVRTGKGTPTGPRRVVDYFNRYYRTGRGFHHTGVWAANQFVSDPTTAPPNHGSPCYTETGILWYNPPGMDLAPMFPFRTSDRSCFSE